MLQITQAPTSPVLVNQRFSILGVASVSSAGMALTLTVDGTYRTNGPEIRDNGTWQVDFLFTATGNRRLRIEVAGESTEIVIPVVTTLPQAQRLRITQIPARLPVLQSTTIEGDAENFQDGTVLQLRSDRQFELARPIVTASRWRATVGFNQPGRRLLEIRTFDGSQSASAEIDVVAVTPPRPRVSFVNPPRQVREETVVSLEGNAENYQDGDQLILRADQTQELARPRVQGGKWQANTLFRQPGNRLIEIIGSEQDRAQTIIEVLAAPPNSFQILARSTWTSDPTPASLPNLTPRRITLHHTALNGSPGSSATQAQDAARMRLIWNSHVNGNGWSDIGYHFIIMQSGRVFSARSELKRGAHDVINDGLGIAFDGIYSSVTINQRQFDAAVALCTVLCRRYGFKNTVTPVPTHTADFGTRNLPLILGHRDRVSTECPGTEGGKTIRMPDIRTAVNGQLN